MKLAETNSYISCDASAVVTAISDKPDGYVAGIASTPATDLYGHRVLAGAFDNSIKRLGLAGPRGVKLLAGHDWHKICGVIKRLGTVNDKLEIEAQLNLNVPYARDLYEIIKQNAGLSYSVGFRLKEFDLFEEDDEDKIKENDGAWLIVKEGELMEVSIVTFPAQVEAEMTLVKQHETMSELEKALVANQFCHSRNAAQRLGKYLRANGHLFLDRPPSSAGPIIPPAHPLLDVHQLRAATDLVAKAKAILSSR